ncbi:hypothetical protein, partial [Salmonella enterica]|uniref:hypothetical protein n=1 Tax=Salmonella enterica TaxID=28901 RepID=UPI003298810D
RVTDAQIRHLLRHGYAIVPGFLTASELRAAQTNASRYFPSANELEATPERYGWIHDDPEHLQIEFPFMGDALNDVSTHPEIIALIQ